MTKVTKHNTELEGEGDNGESSGVDLTVAGNTIGVDNLLEGLGELVGLEVGWGFITSRDDVQDRGHEGARALASSAEGKMHLLSRIGRAPTLGDEALTTEIVVELVHGMVDGLLFLDAVLPVAKMLRNGGKDRRALIPATLKEERKIIEARNDLLKETLAFGSGIGAGIEIGAERLADLLDLALEALTLEESNKHILLGHLTSVGILDALVDLGELDVDVTAGGAEQDLLKDEEVLAKDDTTDKAELHTTSSALLKERRARTLILAKELLLASLTEEDLILLEYVLELNELVVVAVQGLVVSVHLLDLLFQVVKLSL